MIGVAIFAAIGWAGPLSTPLRRLALTGSGVAMGSAMSPAMLKSLGAYPAEPRLHGHGGRGDHLCLRLDAAAHFGLVAADGVLRGRARRFFLRLPGRSQDGKADLPRIAVVQVCRVFSLMALIPLIAGETTTIALPSTGPIDPPLVLVVDSS
jgi:hypothetical protein